MGQGDWVVLRAKLLPGSRLLLVSYAVQELSGKTLHGVE